MRDANIIAACLKSRDAYEKVKDYVDPSDEFTPTGEFWWRLLVQWYERDKACVSIPPDSLLQVGEQFAGSKRDMAVEWYTDIPSDVSPENIVFDVLSLKRGIAYRKLAAAMEADWDHDKVLALTEEHYQLMQATTLGATLEPADIDTILGRDPESLIPLAPKALNRITEGGAEPGTHIVLFARVEAGKTLFAVNMVSRWIRAGKRVVYLGNEEPVRRIGDRIKSNLCNIETKYLKKYEPAVLERIHKLGWKNLTMIDLEPGTPAEVEAAVKEFKPDCLVIDQLRNLHGSTKGSRAQALDQVANRIRNITTKYGLVTLSTGQANAGDRHGAPRLWLQYDDFDESRTGVPASADIMLGLGYDDQYLANNQRAVSVCKNKLTGDHTAFNILIDPQRNRIK